MSMATLRNLACTENDDVLTEMLTAGLDRQLETMIQSNSHKQTGIYHIYINMNIKDIDLESDMKFLRDICIHNYLYMYVYTFLIIYMYVFLHTYLHTYIHIYIGDVELESDVKFLHDILVKNYKELSTFDKWASEVHSGALRYADINVLSIYMCTYLCIFVYW
jgi:hypothetical protein